MSNRHQEIEENSRSSRRSDSADSKRRKARRKQSKRSAAKRRAQQEQGRRRKRFRIPMAVKIWFALMVIILSTGGYMAYDKYSPGKDRMELEDYFTITSDNQVLLILDGAYIEEDGTDNPYIILKNDQLYFELDFLKDTFDDGYVYDTKENTLRYATADEVITAYLNSTSYYVDKQLYTDSCDVVIYQTGSYYVSLSLIGQYTDFGCTFYEDPNRVVIETVGYTADIVTVKKDTPLRRLAGIKSLIVTDAEKDQEVTLIEDYGKWSKVMTVDGIIGCIQNSRLDRTLDTEYTREATMAEREYNHILMDETIILGWHQVTSQEANSNITSLLSSNDTINVISPTWFYLNDNYGGIADLGSIDYVNECHAQGVQVWALVSNLEDSTVETTSVLNTTSSRDALVNNLISAAITYNLDGINIDMEALSSEAADGYIQFIRELSIKCEKNDIVLSIDNYVPTDYTAFYNRSVQADYADYIIIMGYDEHTSLSEEAGSVASISFVSEGVANTLLEVPAEQIILGIPFYTRIWTIDSEGLSCVAKGMSETYSFYSGYNAEPVWSEEDGQYYVQIDLEECTYKIWLEEETSIARKLEVMQTNGLAGAAFWKLGQERSSVWETIKLYSK